MRERTIKSGLAIALAALGVTVFSACGSGPTYSGGSGPSDDARRELIVSADELLISSDITQVCGDIVIDRAMDRAVKAANLDDLQSFVADYVTLMRENSDVVFTAGRSFKSNARSTASTLEGCAPELAAKVRAAAKAM